MTTPLPLAAERDALSQILARLMSEETSLDNLCKLAPRIVSVAANVARIQTALAATSQESDHMAEIMKALREVEAERENGEEEIW